MVSWKGLLKEYLKGKCGVDLWDQLWALCIRNFPFHMGSKWAADDEEHYIEESAIRDLNMPNPDTFPQPLKIKEYLFQLQ